MATRKRIKERTMVALTLIGYRTLFILEGWYNISSIDGCYDPVLPLTYSVCRHHNHNHKTLLPTLETVCKSEKGNAEQY
jgi:hypothetical protein